MTPIYSLGVVLYQLLVGDFSEPVTTDWAEEISDPLLREDLKHCLAGHPEDRFASAELLAKSLRSLPERRSQWAEEQAALATRERIAARWRTLSRVAVAAILISLGLSLVWLLQQNEKVRWAREAALPQLARLADTERFVDAFQLGLRAEKYIPTANRPAPTTFYRDHVIAWAKDLGRAIDYLQTRNDIDSRKLGYFGFSWGGGLGALLPAVESRLKVSVLLVGGFWMEKTFPEVDQVNFAPRVIIPTLMLDGRYDFVFPVESSQLPMFRLLGAPAQDKRHVIADTGHAFPRGELIKESLAWLDKYLGPVKSR